jgi:hypothetical protein
MCTDKVHYRAFLKLCEQSGITVWADKHLLADKGTTGHWDGRANITVHRPMQKSDAIYLAPQRTTAEKVEVFIDGSPNIKWEMALLLHEYGHWKSKHPHLSQVDKQTGYKREEEAWAIGRQVGLDCGVQDFSVFDSEREKALKGYREGLELK